MNGTTGKKRLKNMQTKKVQHQKKCFVENSNGSGSNATLFVDNTKDIDVQTFVRASVRASVRAGVYHIHNTRLFSVRNFTISKK